MACNENYMTVEQVYNLLNTYNFSSNIVPVGARLTVGLNIYNEYFDSSSGLGSEAWEGWAVSNGNNGTVNRTGKFSVYHNPSGTSTFSVIGSTGGQETNQLTNAELPAHTHTHGLSSHNHNISDSGHTHGVTSNSQLSGTTMGAAGGSTYTVNSSGYSVTLSKQEIRVIESPDTHTTSKDIEVFVPFVNKQNYGLLNGTENVLITGSGSVTVPSHTHSLSLGHSHTNSITTATTGLSIDSNNADSSGATTSSSGSGQAFSNLPPFIVEVPIEKII